MFLTTFVFLISDTLQFFLSSLTKSLETPLYKGFEGHERYILSLPNLSTISHVTWGIQEVQVRDERFFQLFFYFWNSEKPYNSSRKYSHVGNKTFPAWEQNVPLLGIKLKAMLSLCTYCHPKSTNLCIYDNFSGLNSHFFAFSFGFPVRNE